MSEQHIRKAYARHAQATHMSSSTYKHENASTHMQAQHRRKGALSVRPDQQMTFERHTTNAEHSQAENSLIFAFAVTRAYHSA
eukprot:307428-Rhodomonas_salina.1